ncbi:Ubiquitin carboxyl-terminal hydrolase 24 [Striga hermonthica]|uniref:Ubiquitin carboxyl-terminal hydrolase n=1 Tax=Striga hermonthica TaxID=68872 RepID=A0A9N7MT87_STRHE|nr:Ubiquitin carboxyl-terminal hydrolase 24 [Striga hermonthica]
MTDLQMLIFGSFTEEEVRSMQCISKPQKVDSEITFGSLDAETLRSVGIVNNRVISELYSPRTHEQPMPVDTTKFSGTESALGLEVVYLKENGCTISTHPGAEELNLGIIEFPESLSYSSEPKFSTNLSLEKPGIHSVGELSSSLKDVLLENSANGVHQVESYKGRFKELNRLKIIPRTFLPCGLVNLGNLCFLNATLQALLSCSPFFELLYELRNRDIPEVGYPTLHAFAEFISNFNIYNEEINERDEKSILETGKPFQPIMFDSILKSFTPDIPDNLSGRPREEDAQEFLSFVMHQMHDELLKLDAQVSNGNGKTASLVSSTDDESEDDDWETVGPRNKTAVTRTQSFVPSKLSNIFGGQLKSVVKARAGNKASVTIQPFLLLHLNICPEQVCTIEDALKLFSAPETLEGYKTSASGKGEVVTASKSVKILELSQIMILHLMRFSYGSQGSTKLHKSVHFPLEFLVGRELLASPSEGRKYELVATITHHGRDPWKGHYTADARHPSGKWVRYDDASVTQITESKVLHDQAYLLFYKQV